VEDQLEKMIERGLIVEDKDEAKHYLRQIGYYRLCGYTLPFQRGGVGCDRHEFRKPIEFRKILESYVFDRKLRLLLLDAIERIEVSFRAALSNSIAQCHTPHWYQNSSLFNLETNGHDALIDGHSTEAQNQVPGEQQNLRRHGRSPNSSGAGGT